MLGRVFALSDFSEQAQFLNEIGKVMRTWRDPAAAEMQCFRIADKLDSNGREFIRRMYENMEPKP
jgi:hypothetical protein